VYPCIIIVELPLANKIQSPTHRRPTEYPVWHFPTFGAEVTWENINLGVDRIKPKSDVSR
jgi:hypothetical protein